jgi:dephospho-CoA kinase
MIPSNGLQADRKHTEVPRTGILSGGHGSPRGKTVKKICLTGGLASGKSTAALFLEQKGAYVIDADKLGHRVYDPGTQAFRQVIDTFGEEIVGEDDHIDRRKLGSIVFGNADELKKIPTPLSCSRQRC